MVCQHIDVIIAVRVNDTYGWMEDKLLTAMALAPAGSLDARIHVTCTEIGVESSDGDHKDFTPISEVEIATGRPKLASIIHETSHSTTGRLAIAACGPESFLYDVRNAVADRQVLILDGYGSCTDMFLHTETYSW